MGNFSPDKKLIKMQQHRLEGFSQRRCTHGIYTEQRLEFSFSKILMRINFISVIFDLKKAFFISRLKAQDCVNIEQVLVLVSKIERKKFTLDTWHCCAGQVVEDLCHRETCTCSALLIHFKVVPLFNHQQARKARRSYLPIWNYRWLTHSLTD